MRRGAGLLAFWTVLLALFACGSDDVATLDTSSPSSTPLHEDRADSPRPSDDPDDSGTGSAVDAKDRGGADTDDSGDSGDSGTGTAQFRGVIVDLDVAWQSESELSERERHEQRARIEAAQDQVVEDLGSHGELRRRLTETAQMSVGVDDEGRKILDGHELVKAVHEDEPDQPAGT